MWKRELNKSMPKMNDVNTPELERENLFDLTLDHLTTHSLNAEFCGHMQARCIKYYLWIGHPGVRALCDRLEVYAFIPPPSTVFNRV
jgi:hypothetical protein